MHTLFDYRLYQYRHQELLERAAQEGPGRRVRRFARRSARADSGRSSVKLHQGRQLRAH